MRGELRERVDPSVGVEKDAALIGADLDQVVGEIEIEIPGKGRRISARSSRWM